MNQNSTTNAPQNPNSFQPPQTILAHVNAIHPLTQHVIQLYLKPEKYIPCQTGQYLLLNKMAFSIANHSSVEQTYEIHFRHYADNPLHQALIQEISQKSLICLDLPYGECTYDKFSSQSPLLLIAGGTGFSQIKAIIEQHIYDINHKTNHYNRPLFLFWMLKTPEDLYMSDLLSNWSKNYPWFQYDIFYSRGTLITMNHLPQIFLQSCTNWQIVLSGPFEMVYYMRDLLIKKGVSSEQLFSDAFAFEE